MTTVDGRPWRIYRTGAGLQRTTNRHWCAPSLIEAKRDAQAYTPVPLKIVIEHEETGELHQRDNEGNWTCEREANSARWLLREKAKNAAPDDPRAPLRSQQHAIDLSNYWWNKERD